MTRTVAQEIISTLEKMGVQHVFGIPGIHNLDIYDNLINSEIEHVTARHEEGAGYMADGYARVTGETGVCLVISGPGLTNIATAMAQAYSDSIPLLVISSQIPREVLGKHTGFLHEFSDSTGFARTVAKESRRVTRKEFIAYYLAEAIQLANSGRPGPVHLEIPLDILQAELKEETNILPYLGIEIDQWALSEQSDNLVEAAQLIASSESPLVITGGGSTKAGKEIKQLVEMLRAPVIPTVAGKGVLPEDHPLCLGARLHFPSVAQILEEHDVVIAIGTGLAAADLWERNIHLNNLIQIDVDPLNKYYKCSNNIFLQGNAKYISQAILAQVRDEMEDDKLAENESSNMSKGPLYKDGAYEVKDLVAKSQVELGETTGIDKDLTYLMKLLKIIRKELPRNGVLVTDMTTPAYLALSEFPVYEPNTFIYPGNFGTLGYAMPAAIGVATADSAKSTLVLTGDGGFQFTLQELAVIAQHNLPINIVIWNDDAYGEIKRNQITRHPGASVAVDLVNPSFVQLAGAYGFNYFSIERENSNEMEQILHQGMNAQGPTIVEVLSGNH